MLPTQTWLFGLVQQVTAPILVLLKQRLQRSMSTSAFLWKPISSVQRHIGVITASKFQKYPIDRCTGIDSSPRSPPPFHVPLRRSSHLRPHASRCHHWHSNQICGRERFASSEAAFGISNVSWSRTHSCLYYRRSVRLERGGVARSNCYPDGQVVWCAPCEQVPFITTHEYHNLLSCANIRYHPVIAQINVFHGNKTFIGFLKLKSRRDRL